MPTIRDINREAHLWYTITSPAYVAHAYSKIQSALDVFLEGMRKQQLAADYAPAPYWSGVLEDILANFDNGLAALKEGNFDPMMAECARLMSVPRGLSEGIQWLEGSENVRMLDFVDEAYAICSRFLAGMSMSNTFENERYRNRTADWHREVPDDLGIVSNNILRNHEPKIYGVIGRPNAIPEYSPDITTTCKTGEIVPWTGVWVPVTGMGTAALAFARQGVQVMQPAYELAREFAEGEYLEASKVVDTAWHPVKPTGRMIPLPPLAGSAASGPEGTTPPASTARCDSGQPCPQSGFWSTPARPNSRRRFMAGEIMPAVGGDYGATIWQWDESQE